MPARPRAQTAVVVIPDKPYFRIGEVAELAGVEPHVLRYWETEFRSIRPEKTRSNQRMYRRKDVERVLEIKRLLYDEGYRIDGAKRKLREPSAARAAATPASRVSLPPAEAGVSRETARGTGVEPVPAVHPIPRSLTEIVRVVEGIEKILDEDEETC